MDNSQSERTKPKFSVPLSEAAVSLTSASGEMFVHAYEDPARKVDPFALLRGGEVRELSDADKVNYVVIKFAYVLFDPFSRQVALIKRVPGVHSHTVGSHSLLLSSGLDAFYGAQKIGGELITNSYQPFTRKLGALAGEFEIPLVRYREFSRPVRFFAFAVRKSKGRFYAFYIHLAAACRPNRLPTGSFELEYPDRQSDDHRDVFEGFFPLAEANRLVSKSGFVVDRFAISALLNKPFKADGLAGLKLCPKRSLAGVCKHVWDALLLRPSLHGFGVDLKKLGGLE